jgi:hypothetical protein
MSSSWPWHFVSLPEDEILRRRNLLDLRGSYAQWSILAAIIIIRIYRFTTTTASAPTPNPRRGPTSWWDLPLVSGSLETRRQYLICGGWLSWLCGLSVWNSGDGMFSSPGPTSPFIEQPNLTGIYQTISI